MTTPANTLKCRSHARCNQASRAQAPSSGYRAQGEIALRQIQAFEEASYQQSISSSRIERLTLWLVGLTIVLSALTVVLTMLAIEG